MDRYTVYELTRTTAAHGRSVFGRLSPPARAPARRGNRRPNAHFRYWFVDQLPALPGRVGLLTPSYPGSFASSRSERAPPCRGPASACAGCREIPCRDSSFTRSFHLHRGSAPNRVRDGDDSASNGRHRHPCSLTRDKTGQTGQNHSARRHPAKSASGGFPAIFPATWIQSKSGRHSRLSNSTRSWHPAT